MQASHSARGRRAWHAAAVLALAAGAPSLAAANELFKCGSTFQDRPCSEAPVQQRFSRTQGSFAIEQVNPDTDRDCAHVAREAMQWWNRLAAGESLKQLQGEIQARKISRYDKSQLRDALTALATVRGPATEVRSQFESRCMAYKRAHGYPTEREVADGAAALAFEGPPPTPTERNGYANSAAAAMRAEAAARRAEVQSRRAAIAARRAARADDVR